MTDTEERPNAQLEYSQLPLPRPRPRWTGSLIVIGLLGSGMALVPASAYQSDGLFPFERFGILLVLAASVVCLTAAAVRIRREIRASERQGDATVSVIGIILGYVLVIIAAWACFTAYRLR